MWHDMYTLKVSRSEIGHLSVSESGCGIGNRCICFESCGRSLWIRACCVIRLAV